MTPEEIRLECLKLAMPKDIVNVDVEWVTGKAKAFADFVMTPGENHQAPRKSVKA